MFQIPRNTTILYPFGRNLRDIRGIFVSPWNGLINFPLIAMGNKDSVYSQIALSHGMNLKKLRYYCVYMYAYVQGVLRL